MEYHNTSVSSRMRSVYAVKGFYGVDEIEIMMITMIKKM